MLAAQPIGIPTIPNAIPSPPDTSRLSAHLQLHFHAPAQGRASALSVPIQQPPWRALRAFDIDGRMALVHLHNVSGGILGGDQLTLTIELEESAQAQVTTTGATRLYRQRPNHCPSVQTTRITIGAGALLEYLPDMLIPYADAHYHQTTQIELGPDAGLFYWEIVAPGRLAHGEAFAYQSLQLDLEITAEGLPIAAERALLEPATRPLDSPARLGPYTHYGVFYICHVGTDAAAWLCLEEELALLADNHTQHNESLWGVSTLAAHGLVVRAVATSARHISATLPHFWQAAKRYLYHADAIPPRKVY